ncbi:unnamed protein product [Oreochromis niloticus]|nr:unnamed protein product [Mustela putorius furo]
MKISALRFLILTVLFKLALGILPGHNHYVSIKMTWSEARTYCREHYTDLSSINNQEDEDALLQLSSLVDSDSKEEVDALLQQDSWIGLYSDDNETWKWSGGTNASFFNWANERNTPVNKICVVSSKSGWLKQNCENKFTFFCFHNNLLLVKENKTWEEALEHCRSRNMELVNLLSTTALIQVLQTSKAAETKGVWTSLRYLAGTWLWVDRAIDDQQSRIQQKLPQCPTWTHRCAAFSLDKQRLDSWDCADRLNFVCYCKLFQLL